MDDGDFVGRSADVEAILGYLRLDTTRVICLCGESGIGKTALAGRVCAHVEGAPAFRFTRVIKRVAFGRGTPEELQDIFIASVALDLVPNLARNADLDEQLDAVLAAVANSPILLLLDNAESLNPAWVQRLITKWLSRANDSTLLLTVRGAGPEGFDADSRFKRFVLGGLKGDEAVLSLLGTELVGRFERDYLVGICEQLGNNPQQLLYLRWLSSEDSDPAQLAAEFRSGPPISLAEAIERRIDRPIIHFLALGHSRSLEVEENLLAWLWDKLGGGSQLAYAEVRAALIEEQLLTPQGGVLRIHPSVHLQLEEQLSKQIGRTHLAHIDYFLAEYYRRRLDTEIGTPDTDLLGRYVYHSLQAGNLAGAFNYLLSPSKIRDLHHQGLALGLRRVFGYFDRYLEDRSRKLTHEIGQLQKGNDDVSRSATRRAQRELDQIRRCHVSVIIELAHCHNDLSDHEKCLQCLAVAEPTVGNLFSDPDQVTLLQSINYLRGISHSDLGQPGHCIRAYLSVVQDAMASRTLGERSILALGYLAFELRFFDTGRALKLGQLALRLAQQQGDRPLIAKNSCSLAQSLFFARDLAESETCFALAEDLCRRDGVGTADVRELGRVLIHRSMIPMAAGDYAKAVESLRSAEELNARRHDRRRMATARGLLGICLWRMGNEAEGKQRLDEAIGDHYRMRDWRSVIMEALSRAYLSGMRTSKEAVAASAGGGGGREPWMVALSDPGAAEPLKVYGDYWSSFFRPILLE